MVLTHGIVQSEYGSGHIVRMSNLKLSSYTALKGQYETEELKEEFNSILSEQADVFVFEGFPFERHQWFEANILDVISKLKDNGKKIVCSIRDIVPPWEPEKEIRVKQTIDCLNNYFDWILVHSDPNFCKLEDSFPYIDLIDTPTSYTGYVSKSFSNIPMRILPRSGFVVSVGNGEQSEDCFEWAIKNIVPMSDGKTTFCFGEQTDRKLINKVSTKSKYEIGLTTIEFRQLLDKSQMHYGHCGYNTFTDVISTKTPSVWFAKKTSSDQQLRIDLWNKRPIRNLNMNGIEWTKDFLNKIGM